MCWFSCLSLSPISPQKCLDYSWLHLPLKADLRGQLRLSALCANLKPNFYLLSYFLNLQLLLKKWTIAVKSDSKIYIFKILYVNWWDKSLKRKKLIKFKWYWRQTASFCGLPTHLLTCNFAVCLEAGLTTGATAQWYSTCLADWENKVTPKKKKKRKKKQRCYNIWAISKILNIFKLNFNFIYI